MYDSCLVMCNTRNEYLTDFVDKMSQVIVIVIIFFCVYLKGSFVPMQWTDSMIR